MHHTAVINVVGLTPALLGPDTPNLNVLARNGSGRPLRTVTPAVTSTVQSTFLTGLPPSGHGVVGNGWYFRDLAQGLVLAPVQPPGFGREGLGKRPPA